MAKKGKEIRFIGGKYGGKKGWVDLDRTPGIDTTPVIVNLGKKGEKVTYVYDYSFEVEATTAPTCFAEAIIQQCPDIDCSLTKVCRDFAKCNIKVDPTGFINIVQKKITEAVNLQDDKGSKALYRIIKFNVPHPSGN
jgi:hypothetical protein